MLKLKMAHNLKTIEEIMDDITKEDRDSNEKKI